MPSFRRMYVMALAASAGSSFVLAKRGMSWFSTNEPSAKTSVQPEAASLRISARPSNEPPLKAAVRG